MWLLPGRAARPKRITATGATIMFQDIDPQKFEYRFYRLGTFDKDRLRAYLFACVGDSAGFTFRTCRMRISFTYIFTPSTRYSMEHADWTASWTKPTS